MIIRFMILQFSLNRMRMEYTSQKYQISRPAPAHHPAPRRTCYPQSPSCSARWISPQAPGAPQYRHSRAQVSISQRQVEYRYGVWYGEWRGHCKVAGYYTFNRSIRVMPSTPSKCLSSVTIMDILFLSMVLRGMASPISHTVVTYKVVDENIE